MNNREELIWVCSWLLSLLLAPLLSGVINRVKAVVSGRRGPRLLQSYYDITKLMRKGWVYSRTSTWVLRLYPRLLLASLLLVSALLPMGLADAPLRFSGDFILLVYLLGLTRFFGILAALDVGSSFAGMGASREAQFAVLAEVGLFTVMAALVQISGRLDLSGLFNGYDVQVLGRYAPALLLLAVALFMLLLFENCRVPFDDPETHLELTMIHEAMILDYGGPDLGLISYASALKLWIFCSCFVLVLLPAGYFTGWAGVPVFVAGNLLTAAGVGLVESVTARYRFLKVPQILMVPACLAGIALCLVLVFRK